MSVVVKVLH